MLNNISNISMSLSLNHTRVTTISKSGVIARISHLSHHSITSVTGTSVTGESAVSISSISGVSHLGAITRPDSNLRSDLGNSCVFSNFFGLFAGKFVLLKRSKELSAVS